MIHILDRKKKQIVKIQIWMPKTEVLSESRTNKLRLQVQSIYIDYSFPQCKPNSIEHFSWREFFWLMPILYNDCLMESYMQWRSKQILPTTDGNKSLVHCEGRQLFDAIPTCINASKIFRSGTIPSFASARFQFITFKHYFIHKIILQKKKFMNNSNKKITASKHISTENKITALLLQVKIVLFYKDR